MPPSGNLGLFGFFQTNTGAVFTKFVEHLEGPPTQIFDAPTTERTSDFLSKLVGSITRYVSRFH
jgi:hypothetical protein